MSLLEKLKPARQKSQNKTLSSQSLLDSSTTNCHTPTKTVIVEGQSKKSSKACSGKAKTQDQTKGSVNPRFNFSGWGNNQNIINNNQPLSFSISGTAARYGVSNSTAWRTTRLREPTFGKTGDILQVVGNYDDSFRIRACQEAIKVGPTKAAEKFGCSKDSIYNWLKVYDNTHNYFHK